MLPIRGSALLVALIAIVLSLVPRPGEAGAPTDWLEVRSPHFTLLTDAATERGVELAVELERFRAVFARVAPEMLLRAPVPTRIFAFCDAEGYAAYKSTRDGGGVRTLGQYLGDRDGNFITLDADPQQIGALGVVYHEYVHDLLRRNLPRVPLWFNEGLAEYYRTFAVEGERAIIGRPPEDRLRWFETGAELDLGEVLTLPPEGVHQGEAAEVGRVYAVSWALVHYLLSGGPDRLGLTADFLALLAEGHEPLEAFEDSFSMRIGSLEAELGAYVRRRDFPVAAIPLKGLPSRAEVLMRRLPLQDAAVHLGDLATRLRSFELAEAHYLRALRLDPDHPEALAGLAHLQDLKGSREEARWLYRDALDHKPQRALSYLRYGRHLLARLETGVPAEEVEGVVREARRMLSDALLLEPGFAEVRALLGATYLYGEADPMTGVSHLKRAREALPLRMDLVVTLVRLHGRAGQFERARALVDGVLRRWADPQVAEGMAEEVERGALLEASRQALQAGDGERAVRLFDQAVSLTSDPEIRQDMENRLSELQRQIGRP